MENDKKGDTAESQRPLQSLEGIVLNDYISSIIIKLPGDPLDLIPEEIKDVLSYREYTALLGFFNLKTPRNRTKIDMIEAFLAYTSDVWSELFETASKRLSDNEKCKEIANKTPQRVKKQKQIPVIPQNQYQIQRTPYNSRLNDIISDMYTSQRENWEDVLMLCNPEEQEHFREVFHAINPTPLELKSSISQRDHILLHYLNGPSRLASDSLETLETNAANLKSMTEKLVGKPA